MPSASSFNPGLQNPYTMNYQFNIQRQIAPDLMWEIGCRTERGGISLAPPLHLPDRLTGERPNPSLIPGGYYIDNSESTNFNSLQTSLRKRFSRNFSFDLHYT